MVAKFQLYGNFAIGVFTKFQFTETSLYAFFAVFQLYLNYAVQFFRQISLVRKVCCTSFLPDSNFTQILLYSFSAKLQLNRHFIVRRFLSNSSCKETLLYGFLTKFHLYKIFTVQSFPPQISLYGNCPVRVFRDTRCNVPTHYAQPVSDFVSKSFDGLGRGSKIQ